MEVKVSLSIGYANADREDKLEIDDNELVGMTDDEINDFIFECVKDWSDNYIELSYEILS